ncbi:MAG: hypothetical protein QOH12_1263 [Solirubrobacteraceae bacterium]|jgi:hypothetical protein|nr:hypothetical protein [Solirubrobacteraceae bacterium]
MPPVAICLGLSRTFAVAEDFEIRGDIAWPLFDEELADRFTETKFSLARRVSVGLWMASIIAHTDRTADYWGHEAAYGSARAAAETPDLCRALYADHLAGVRDVFASSERFLEVCRETGSGWAEICGFRGVPVSVDVAFPHSGRLATTLPTAGSHAT